MLLEGTNPSDKLCKRSENTQKAVPMPAAAVGSPGNGIPLKVPQCCISAAHGRKDGAPSLDTLGKRAVPDGVHMDGRWPGVVRPMGRQVGRVWDSDRNSRECPVCRKKHLSDLASKPLKIQVVLCFRHIVSVPSGLELR